jgi:hypothetical protein
MSASRGIGNALVAIGPGSVVTTLCRRGVGGGLLTRQSPLSNEHRVRRIAQIPDIDVVVRLPSIGQGLEDRVAIPVSHSHQAWCVALPPLMMTTIRTGADGLVVSQISQFVDPSCRSIG